MKIFVLLYNSGTDKEGIHSIELKGKTIVLMFEDKDDATRYCGLLEAQDFPLPTVEMIDIEEIRNFCIKLDYECKLVERNFVPKTWNCWPIGGGRLRIEGNITETRGGPGYGRGRGDQAAARRDWSAEAFAAIRADDTAGLEAAVQGQAWTEYAPWMSQTVVRVPLAGLEQCPNGGC